MARSFLTPVDMNKLEILNLRLQNLAAAPGSPVAGQIYHDTVLLASYIWNGSAWVSTDASKLVGTIPNTALATNPLARANHTGTQLAATISDFSASVVAFRLNHFTVPNANVPWGGFKITGLGTPTVAGDAAEYSWVIGQVQSAAAGIASRAPVRLVAVANLGLTGLAAIDGVTPIAGDRILATAQSAPAANGVYIASAGAWARATTEDAANELIAGALWLVTEGTTFAASQWRMATTGAITVGTTALSIVQFGAASVYTAGNGVTLTGSSFSVNPAVGGGISVAAGGVSVDTTVVARKYSTNIGDGSTTAIIVTHALGTQDVHLQCKRATTPFDVVECDMAATSTTTATFTFVVAPSAAQYRVTVIG